MTATEPPTLADFIGCTTVAGLKQHLALRTWPQVTLCGQAACLHFNLEGVASGVLPDCKQCIKSYVRQIEGRPH